MSLRGRNELAPEVVVVVAPLLRQLPKPDAPLSIFPFHIRRECGERGAAARTTDAAAISAPPMRAAAISAPFAPSVTSPAPYGLATPTAAPRAALTAPPATPSTAPATPLEADAMDFAPGHIPCAPSPKAIYK
eukprot:3673591-Pyramimonas_sp.AAC.1